MKPIVFGHSLGDDGRPLVDAYIVHAKGMKNAPRCVFIMLIRIYDALVSIIYSYACYIYMYVQTTTL